MPRIDNLELTQKQRYQLREARRLLRGFIETLEELAQVLKDFEGSLEGEEKPSRKSSLCGDALSGRDRID